MSIDLDFAPGLGPYLVSDVYDPVTNTSAKIVPAKGSVVIVNGDELYVSQGYDTTSFASSLTPSVPAQDQFTYAAESSGDYGNAVLRAYFDKRSLPYRLDIDNKIVVRGTEQRSYRLIRYPGLGSQETVISKYYDATNTMVSQQIPLVEVSSGSNLWYCPYAQITDTLTDNEALRLEIVNEIGSVTQTYTLYAKASTILNDTFSYQPKIVSVSVVCSQMSSDGSIYVYQGQDIADLGITARLHYADGSTSDVQIDGTKCILYGLERFVASYVNLKQVAMIKYLKSENEVVVPSSGTLTDATVVAVSTTFTVRVVTNNLTSSIKLLPVPVWSDTLSGYILNWRSYSVDHSGSAQITGSVNIVDGTFVGTNFTDPQTFTASIDLKSVDPKTYPDSTIYQQQVTLKLQPKAAYERYTITDAPSSPYMFGKDVTNNRRAVVYYDQNLKQYFVPSRIFANADAFLLSFYYDLNPPVNGTTEATAPAPTHFIVRSIQSGSMVVSDYIPIDNYTAAFSILNGDSGNYVGSNVIVEFYYNVGNNTPQVLFGAPVDVYTGTYSAATSSTSTSSTADVVSGQTST